jgi:gluconate 2-dehydrogenase gamma chain
VKKKPNYTSFFDSDYQTPAWFTQKKVQQNSRRNFIKSAAGMGVITSFPLVSIASSSQTSLKDVIQQDPWLTLEATLNQLLPESATGPSANDINALAYLYQVMTVQPTEQDEKDFIIKGVSWLNAYAQSEKSSNFVSLSLIDKEQLLKGISQSTAGQNWLNTLLSYIFQAMLAPPSYGGNPSGIGWQWLAHQPGFPLPKEGQRYFELPSRARIDFISQVKHSNHANNERKAIHQGTRKA